MSNCKNICRLCNNFITTNNVSVVTVGGVDTLVLDLPASIPCGYTNCRKVCIAVTQNIPATATILMPVGISIGGNTTTVYPLLDECCQRITACGIRTRTRYATRVSTLSGGSFTMLGKVCCYPQNAVPSLPIPVATSEPASVSANVAAYTPTVASKGTTTKTKTTTNKTAEEVTVK